jgi:hypothetical protein
MDVDDGHLPEQDSQVGASEAIVQEPTSQGGCSETDDDNDGRSDDDSGIEGLSQGSATFFPWVMGHTT